MALLKEERSNLLVENEDLCEKVRAAQTLSRKVVLRLDDGNVENHLRRWKSLRQDSVKARQFETELAHIKDEFERLRLAYESTKEHINAMEARLKPEAGDQTEKVTMLHLPLDRIAASLFESNWFSWQIVSEDKPK